jgi:hypothetical protein
MIVLKQLFVVIELFFFALNFLGFATKTLRHKVFIYKVNLTAKFAIPIAIGLRKVRKDFYKVRKANLTQSFASRYFRMSLYKILHVKNLALFAPK